MRHATLKELELKSQYRTNPLDRGSVVGSFYIPVLETAVQYDRLSGFFSSSSLALAAKGVAALIANGGKMRLICSPRLSPNDIAAFKAMVTSTWNPIMGEACLNRAFSPTESQIEKDHLGALGWMLKNQRLEVMLAVVLDEEGRVSTSTLFHPKVGLVTDSVGDEISFSGSNNETVSGWADNQEEFKVFKSWEPGQYPYFQNDRYDFEQYWRNNVDGVSCFDLPTAFEKRLIQASEGFDREEFLAKYYIGEQRRRSVWKSLNLRDYQSEAIDKWVKSDYALLFEMATGSGKTRTAIGCINVLMAKERTGCIVVTAPRIALCEQWRRELDGRLCEASVVVVANSDNQAWRTELGRAIARLSLRTSPTRWLIVLTSHLTAAGENFRHLIDGLSKKVPLMLVSDETHALGAEYLQHALMPSYRYRVGLSATPERMFDDVGTRLITGYFGNAKYVFSLGDAIRHRNVSTYRYYPIVTPLSPEERNEYDRLTDRISKLTKMLENEYDPEVKQRLEQALRNRAQIVMAAESKLSALRELLQKGDGAFDRDVIAFTCDQNLEQVIRVFTEEMKTTRRFTYRESDPAVRQEILEEFACGSFAALVAMKCLDEGIDIPTAETAILVSSTTNPREYIQRIGRVLRKSPNKRFARVYDFIVSIDTDGKEILERDLKRALYVAEYAENASDAFDVLYLRKGVKE